MRIHITVLVVVILCVFYGCTTTDSDRYRYFPANEDYATIEDNPPDGSGRLPWIYIRSIDRKFVDNRSRISFGTDREEDGNESNVIPLAIGEHQFLVVSGARLSKLRDILDWFIFNIDTVFYSETVLVLRVEKGRHYRVRAILDRDGDFADFWIEDADTGVKITETVRKRGLERR